MASPTPFRVRQRANREERHCAAMRSCASRSRGPPAISGQILLTRNEVGHAGQHRYIIALCVVAGIQVRVDAQGALQTSGGPLLTLRPWVVDAGELTSLAFAYTLPRRRTR